jgi:hypothetical protein
MISRWIVALCIAFTFALAGLGAAFSCASSKLWPTAESRAYDQYFQSLIWYNCLPC